VIGQLSQASIERIPGMPGRRAETLNYAALVLASLLTKARPKRLVFSGWGMREGQLLRCLGPKLRAQDPLISGCQTLAERTGRFSIRGEEILEWTAPLFAGEDPEHRRLRYAACLLSDIGWPEHPDYRAEHSFHRVLRIPFAGLKHPERVLIALAVFIRYNGEADAPLVAPVRRLLDDSELGRVHTLGLALRLAHTLSGSAPGLLSRTKFRLGSKTLTLEVVSGKRIFASETVVRRLRSLARSMGCESQIG
jgi:exopolyphosphatase/guanosine-5'-triphosphate,3'-diphosphate pyrophosphatase